jgi:peroxiredoxin
MKTRKRNARSWWRTPKVVRRILIGALSSGLIVAAGLWLTMSLGAGHQAETYLAQPAPAPRFSLPTTSGVDFTSSEHIGKHNLLLYFSEGIGCGACWDQIVDLEADWGRFQAQDVELVSVMVDPLGQLKSEAAARGITGFVAYDGDKAVSERYNAMEASMHPGAKPGHTFVLVTKAGQMIWRWDWSGHGKPMYLDVNELYRYVSDSLQKDEQPGAKLSRG